MLTPEEERFIAGYFNHTLTELDIKARNIIAKLRQPDLTEWVKTAAQESADDIIAAMLRIRLSKEDVAQLIIARLTTAEVARLREALQEIADTPIEAFVAGDRFAEGEEYGISMCRKAAKAALAKEGE